MRLQPAARAREIGPVGTAGRIAGGLLLIALPIVRDQSIGAWDLAIAVSVLPGIAAVTGTLTRAAYQQLAPRTLDRSPWSAPSLTVLAIVLAAATGLTFVTPANEPAIWMFLGISMLVAGIRGKGGCEVMALPNAFRSRDDGVDCILFGPIDAAEARHRAPRAPEPGARMTT